jgi:tRNA pseudouridine38-40 synthase
MRFALGVEFEGSGFSGWQRQSSGRTVQASMETALARVADAPVEVVCAGRTDTGVHATGQVVHFDTRAVRGTDSWLRGGNSHLPHDIRIQWARPVADGFHARFSARRRHYRYVISSTTTSPAILRHLVCHVRQPLDLQVMRAAASALLGEHDFTSLRAAACQAKTPVRTIHRLDVTRSGDWVYIDVEANAFLHHMVRCIAGMLISIGVGDRPPGWMEEVLAARDRTRAGVNAPAAGLYLVRVEYPVTFQIPATGWLPVYG